MSDSEQRCGFIAFVGRPNVGKSTLLNRLLQQKISITSPRAQTTRHRILGILTEAGNQMVFVDTPGLHQGAKRAINKRMNKIAVNAIHDVDVVVWLLEAGRTTAEDQWIETQLKKISCPVIVVVNKIDLLADKTQLLPQIEQLTKKLVLHAVIPLSATREQKITELKKEILSVLPRSEQLLFPEQMTTDRPPEFIAAEMIREKLTRHLHEELPYTLTVEIEHFERKKKIIEIHAIIWVAREGQKSIVIGKKGQRLKQIATEARLSIEKSLQNKVDLRCWVKTKSDWMDDEKQLDLWGYHRS